MTEYVRAPAGGIRRLTQGENLQPLFVVMNTEEFRTYKNQFAHKNQLLHSIGSIRYCKAEWFQDCIIGTLRVPQKNEHRTPLASFAFCMTAQTLFLIEDTGSLKPWTEKLTEAHHDAQTPNQLLLQLMEQMIEDDILYLSHLEKETENTEDALASNAPKEIFFSLMQQSRKLSELNVYYAQLTDIGELMQAHACFQTGESADIWDKYTRRAERLQSYVNFLKENVLQLQSLYQSLQDAQQNRVMGILTVVTTLFLPLTLLTGWYGMNFRNMPELQWEYGYYAVIAVAAILVVLEIICFKRKKFF